MTFRVYFLKTDFEIGPPMAINETFKRLYASIFRRRHQGMWQGKPPTFKLLHRENEKGFRVQVRAPLDLCFFFSAQGLIHSSKWQLDTTGSSTSICWFESLRWCWYRNGHVWHACKQELSKTHICSTNLFNLLGGQWQKFCMLVESVFAIVMWNEMQPNLVNRVNSNSKVCLLIYVRTYIYLYMTCYMIAYSFSTLIRTVIHLNLMFKVSEGSLYYMNAINDVHSKMLKQPAMVQFDIDSMRFTGGAKWPHHGFEFHPPKKHSWPKCQKSSNGRQAKCSSGNKRVEAQNLMLLLLMEEKSCTTWDV